MCKIPAAMTGLFSAAVHHIHADAALALVVSVAEVHCACGARADLGGRFAGQAQVRLLETSLQGFLDFGELVGQLTQGVQHILK